MPFNTANFIREVNTYGVNKMDYQFIPHNMIMKGQKIIKQGLSVSHLTTSSNSVLWLFSSANISSVQFSSVQSLSRVWLFATPWIAEHQASLSITISWSSLKLTSIESVMPSSHLILCRPLLFLPPIPPNIRVFSNESTLRMRWPKYWSFSFSIIPSKENPGLISFRMDWLDLLAVQGTHESSPTPQFKSINSLVLSFIVQLSHPYMTIGKTIALTRQTFVAEMQIFKWSKREKGKIWSLLSSRF